MILLYPFEDKKENIKISCDYSLNQQELNGIFLIDNYAVEIEDFYPLEAEKEMSGQLFPLENLWTTTCFEMFLKNRDSSDYYELNFNSKGDWNVFYFTDSRQRISSYKSFLDLKLKISNTGSRTKLTFRFDIKKMENLKLPCSVNMAMVLKTISGTTFWSQKHNGVKADFHDFKNFTLNL
jgi:hypothetical protein